MILGLDAQPKRLVAFGAGAQIAAHLSLFCKQYTSIASCTVFNRSVNERLTSLVSKLRGEYPAVDIEAQALPQDASDASFRQTVQEADVIITATSSTTPFFPSAYVKRGAHLCLIGSYTPHMYVRRAIDSLPSRCRLAESKPPVQARGRHRPGQACRQSCSRFSCGMSGADEGIFSDERIVKTKHIYPRSKPAN